MTVASVKISTSAVTVQDTSERVAPLAPPPLLLLSPPLAAVAAEDDSAVNDSADEDSVVVVGSAVEMVESVRVASLVAAVGVGSAALIEYIE